MSEILVIGTDCICSCKSKYHMITSTTLHIIESGITHPYYKTQLFEIFDNEYHPIYTLFL
jgi:hypothetical protein